MRLRPARAVAAISMRCSNAASVNAIWISVRACGSSSTSRMRTDAMLGRGSARGGSISVSTRFGLILQIYHAAVTGRAQQLEIPRRTRSSRRLGITLAFVYLRDLRGLRGFRDTVLRHRTHVALGLPRDA